LFGWSQEGKIVQCNHFVRWQNPNKFVSHQNPHCLWSNNTGWAPWPSQFRIVPELRAKLQCSAHIFQSFKDLTHLSKCIVTQFCAFTCMWLQKKCKIKHRQCDIPNCAWTEGQSKLQHLVEWIKAYTWCQSKLANWRMTEELGLTKYCSNNRLCLKVLFFQCQSWKTYLWDCREELHNNTLNLTHSFSFQPS
jgi:hypothetical protein